MRRHADYVLGLPAGARIPIDVSRAEALLRSRPQYRAAMAAEFARHGATEVALGQASYLSPDDWSDTSLFMLSRFREELFVVAVLAKRDGAFSRLVDTLEKGRFAHGWRGKDAVYPRPVVCAPIGPIMPAIMRRWNWQPSGGGAEWRPPAQGPWRLRAEVVTG